MKNLIWIITMILLGYSFDSRADVCVTEQIFSNNTALNYMISSDEIRCQKLKTAQDSLDVLSIITNAGSLYAACTGVGTPVAVYLGLAGLSLQSVKFAVSQLPCDEDTDAVLIDQLVKETVCTELEKNGLVCAKSNKYY